MRTVGKPVLARGLLVGEQWDKLRTEFARGNIADMHPDLEFKTSNIPYGRQFGIKQTEVTMGIAQYMEYMRDQADAAADPAKGGAGNHNCLACHRHPPPESCGCDGTCTRDGHLYTAGVCMPMPLCRARGQRMLTN